MATSKNPTQLVTGLVRFCHCHVFVPKAPPGNPKKKDGTDVLKYSVAILIPKTDVAQIDAVNAGVAAAAELGKGKWGGKIPLNLKRPLRDGDTESNDPAYAGHMFMNANSDSKPNVVKSENGMIVPITERDEFYSGVFGRASVNFYAFDVAGNKGVAVGLNNLQKIKDGANLGGGRTDAAEDFATPFEVEDDLAG